MPTVVGFNQQAVEDDDDDGYDVGYGRTMGPEVTQHSVRSGRDALRRAADQQRALEECPIRTLYNPKDRRRGSPAGGSDGSRSRSAPHVSREPSGRSSGRSTNRSSGASSRASDVSHWSPRVSRVSSVVSQKAGGWGRLAATLAVAAGHEFIFLRDGVVDALASSGRNWDEEGASRISVELWDLLYKIEKTADKTADDSGAAVVQRRPALETSYDEKRLAEDMRLQKIKASLAALRGELQPESQTEKVAKSSYDLIASRGKNHCGADDAVEKAAEVQALLLKLAPDFTIPDLTTKDRLRTLMGKTFEREVCGSSSLQKFRIQFDQLQEVWLNMPGDSAVRRVPEMHEVVYDFWDRRVSMPRYFGEKATQAVRKGRAIEAGQLLEVKADQMELTLLTHLPRRTAFETADRLDGICDVKAIDDLQSFPRAPPKGMKGLEYNHLHGFKRPPGSKAWMEWRELQASKAMQQMKEREQAIMKARLANLERLAAVSGVKTLTSVIEDMAATRSFGASSSRFGSKSTEMKKEKVEVPKSKIPWDARPGPEPEEQERLARLWLPDDLLQAHLVRAAKAEARRAAEKSEADDEDQRMSARASVHTRRSAYTRRTTVVQGDVVINGPLDLGAWCSAARLFSCA